MSQNSPDEVIFVDSSSGEKVELTFILYLTKSTDLRGKRILVWGQLMVRKSYTAIRIRCAYCQLTALQERCL
ncbi:hypothetical protein TNCV_3396031 [Trichonephila clavipes]|nr:hypothetical protein TNCV_3396031 [Trichonephila clavipes]